MTDVEHLVRELNSAGLLPAGFGPLLQQVPRDEFLPDRIWIKTDGVYDPVERNGNEPEWSAAVYRNRAVVTQFDDGETVWPDVGGRPTSSASMPSVVMAMLEALGAEPGHAVLEIGTGTGWNAALLSRQVGKDGRVNTIEVDLDLIRHARAHLPKDRFPNVRTIVGDGLLGDPERAPFDRVIATASVHLGRVPYAWVAQTRPGGQILAPIRADLASGPLVRFEVGDDGTAVGRILPMGVGFMEVRSQRTPTTASDNATRWDTDADDVRMVQLDPKWIFEDPAARWAVAVAMPSCRYDVDDATDETPFEVWWLRDPLSGSWTSVVPLAEDDPRKGFIVRQAGPRRLWDELTAAYEWWQRNGRPPLSAWKWTVTSVQQAVALG